MEAIIAGDYKFEPGLFLLFFCHLSHLIRPQMSIGPLSLTLRGRLLLLA